MAIVAGSFWMRKRVGYRAWRKLHYLSFLIYVLSFVHGVSAGTDTSAPVVFAMYVASGGVVSWLLALRMLSRRHTARATQPATATRAA
jgi:DMSO/TMAO reductase YedYZ heme-binding membrane subunit